MVVRDEYINAYSNYSPFSPRPAPASLLGMHALLHLVRPVKPVAQPKYSVIDGEQFVISTNYWAITNCLMYLSSSYLDLITCKTINLNQQSTTEIVSGSGRCSAGASAQALTVQPTARFVNFCIGDDYVAKTRMHQLVYDPKI